MAPIRINSSLSFTELSQIGPVLILDENTYHDV